MGGSGEGALQAGGSEGEGLEGSGGRKAVGRLGWGRGVLTGEGGWTRPHRALSVGSEVTAGCVWGQDMRGLSYQIRSMLDLEGAWRAH